MQVEVGSIVEGKITGITNFGAFVAMANGKTGMVHISEISNSYVKEIGDYLSDNQEVKVKVLSIAADGKISLSIKQCEPATENAGPGASSGAPAPSFNKRPMRPQQGNRRGGGGRDIVWQPKAPENAADLSFEDMISKYKQVSNDRMGELKRANDPRRSRRSSSTSK